MNAERSTTRGVAHYPGIPAPAPARAHTRLLLVPSRFATVLLASCGGGESVRTAPPKSQVAMPRTWPVVTPDDPQRANAVLMRAIGLVGTPYRWGGNSPEGGFDCSGLVNYVFRDMASVQLPRTSRDLSGTGGRIALDRLAAADLVFFASGGAVTHVGIYVGEGRFVHAPSTGGTVRLDHLDGPYWAQHFAGERRVLQ